MKEAYFLKTESLLALQSGRISQIASVGILVDPSWKSSHSSHLQPALFEERDVVLVFHLQSQEASVNFPMPAGYQQLNVSPFPKLIWTNWYKHHIASSSAHCTVSRPLQFVSVCSDFDWETWCWTIWRSVLFLLLSHQLSGSAQHFVSSQAGPTPPGPARPSQLMDFQTQHQPRLLSGLLEQKWLHRWLHHCGWLSDFWPVIVSGLCD